MNRIQSKIWYGLAFSQIIRTLRNNSKQETTTTELELCLQHFENSGYKKEKLEELKQSAINRTNTNTNNTQESNSIAFPVHFFDGIQELKDVIRSLENEFRQLIGDVRIIFALKKRSSVGNSVVRNKQLSIPSAVSSNQWCNSAECRQCPLTISKSSVTINNVVIPIPKSLNCKSKNNLFMAMQIMFRKRSLFWTHNPRMPRSFKWTSGLFH